MNPLKSKLLSSTVIPLMMGTGIAVSGALVFGGPGHAFSPAGDLLNPVAKSRPIVVQLAQCNPCAAKKACNPCNPCAAKKACKPVQPVRRQEGVQPLQPVCRQEGVQPLQSVQSLPSRRWGRFLGLRGAIAWWPAACNPCNPCAAIEVRAARAIRAPPRRRAARATRAPPKRRAARATRAPPRPAIHAILAIRVARGRGSSFPRRKPGWHMTA